MKKIFIFSFLLLNILAFSQINRFYYELNYKPNKDSSKIIKENGIVTQKEVIGEVQNFNYVEKINFNWILSNESQKIENYNTQKATTDFGGRKWNAWFTTENPHQ